MPYAIVTPPVSTGLRLQLANEISWNVQAAPDFEIEYEYASEPGANRPINGRVFDQTHNHGGGTSFRMRRYVYAGNNLSLSQSLTASVAQHDHVHFAYDSANDVCSLTINGVLEYVGPRYAATGSFILSGFFVYANSSGTWNAQSLKYFKLTRNGVLENHWLNTTGTGNVWEDIVSGNDATFVGDWPTDDSQWVYYDDGGSTSPILTAPFASLITANSITPNVIVTF